MMISILEVILATLKKDQEQWKEVSLAVVDIIQSLQEDSVEEVRETAKRTLEEWNKQA